MQTMLKKPVDKNHKKNEKMSPSGENRSLSDGEAPAAMTPQLRDATRFQISFLLAKFSFS